MRRLVGDGGSGAAQLLLDLQGEQPRAVGVLGARRGLQGARSLGHQRAVGVDLVGLGRSASRARTWSFGIEALIWDSAPAAAVAVPRLEVDETARFGPPKVRSWDEKVRSEPPSAPPSTLTPPGEEPSIRLAPSKLACPTVADIWERVAL